MQIYFFDRSIIKVAPDRQRQEFEPQAIRELASSILELGLLQPLVVRDAPGDEVYLVAGERRLRAIEELWFLGQTPKIGEYAIEENQIPCVWLGEVDDVDAFEMEFDENVKRVNLSWQEEARATAKLMKLRQLQAERDGTEPPTIQTIIEAKDEMGMPVTPDKIRAEILVADRLDDPDVAKATTAKEALKIIKRKEERQRNEALGIEVGKTLTAASHTILQGDCLEIMAGMEGEQFDIILTDPPYGMGADEFGDSGGKTAAEHFYDDSPENFQSTVGPFITLAFRVAKPQAHLYLFCDIQWFDWLKKRATEAGWKVFRTPLTWINPSAYRAPWPDQGPQRKTQWILYAVKGDKHVLKVAGDALVYGNDKNLGHNAQKPVDLLRDLLARSATPGSKVLDPFCGSGSIFPAVHSLKCIATGIEQNAAAYGLAVKRLGELK